MMRRFSLTLLATTAIGVLACQGASAADILRKAPPPAPPPAPVFSWTGCHVGAHVGWGWGKANVDESQNSSGGHLNTDGTPGSGGITTSGAVFGGQLGCDYQFWGQWVIGAEGMFAGTDINGTANDPAEDSPFGNLHTIKVKQDWIGSVTGRLGYAWNQTLWYVRGGGAWTHNRWDLSNADNAFFYGNTVQTQNLSGWTIGAGLEWALTPNWTAFVEYDYYRFDGKDLINQTTFDDTYHVHTSRQTVNVVKVGVNYRFNWLGGLGGI
jgi:outer membrane immunogenic protein